MDQTFLVENAKSLVLALDEAGICPQMAMIVSNNDVGSSKIWIVPRDDMKDKYEFYRIVSEVIAKNREKLGGLSASDVEYITRSHPAAQMISSFVRLDGLGSVHFSGNVLNGYYMPDGVILRSSLKAKAS